MLVMTRKPGESVVLYRVPISNTQDVMLKVELLSVRGQKARIGFSAKKEFVVDRIEVLEKKLQVGAVQRPLRVLIVEDDPRTRLALTTALRAMGLEVEQAADPAVAVQKAIQTKPEVLMVGLSNGGQEVVKAIRQRPELSRATLIALAERDAIREEQARDLGFSAVIPTIPELEELQRVVSLAG